MDLELKTKYWNDLQAKDAFKKFILDIHNLDFNEWESRGYWDDAFTPFTFFKGGEVISSICIYLLDAVIQGRKTKLIQISGVGTKNSWRRKGLSRELTDMGLDWAKGQHEGVFLFADEEAIPFYLRCGFSPLDESQEFCQIEPVYKKAGIVQLDPSNQQHLDKIHLYAKSRVPISNDFSVFSSRLLMFHALYTMRNKMYEIPELNCLVFFDRKEDVVNIYDILGEEIPSFQEIYPYISSKTDTQIDFHFHTDKLSISDIQTRTVGSNNTFVKDHFPLVAPAFPYTARA